METKKEYVVNIIGYGATRLSVPDTGENWGLCGIYKHADKIRIDKLFFMDDLLSWMPAWDKNFRPEYTFIQFCKENPNVELISKFDQILGDNQDATFKKPITRYPLNEASELLPGVYFTTTIAYVIAYAILKKVDRIRLYGFEIWSQVDANEYAFQRPCVDMWLSFAMGRGIKIEVPYYLTQAANNPNNFYGYKHNEQPSTNK